MAKKKTAATSLPPDPLLSSPSSSSSSTHHPCRYYADLQDIHLLSGGAAGRPEVRLSFVAWVLLKYSLAPADLFAVQTEHQHDMVKETHTAMTTYQKYLIAEGERQEEIEALRGDAEAGGLVGGRAMIRLNLLENTGKEERGKSEVMLKKAQRAASRYLKLNNPFEKEKAAHEAAAAAEKEATAMKRSASKAKIAAMGAMFEQGGKSTLGYTTGDH